MAVENHTEDTQAIERVKMVTRIALRIMRLLDSYLLHWNGCSNIGNSLPLTLPPYCQIVDVVRWVQSVWIYINPSTWAYEFYICQDVYSIVAAQMQFNCLTTKSLPFHFITKWRCKLMYPDKEENELRARVPCKSFRLPDLVCIPFRFNSGWAIPHFFCKVNGSIKAQQSLHVKI